MEHITQHIKNFDWSLKSIAKVAVALVIVVVALAIVLGVLKTVAKSVFGYDIRSSYAHDGYGVMDDFVEEFGFNSVAQTKGMALGGRGGAMEADLAVAEYGIADSRLAPIPPIYDEGGADAEEYERRNYNAHYETRRFEQTCTAIADLKPLEYVVFDNSNKSEDWCSYTFRVEVAHEDAVVETLKTLNPRDFNIDTATIERSVEYTDSELAMQQRRLVSLQETLAQAEDAFDALLARARAQGDTATLSEVINNKIATSERLNQQILNAQDRVDRLTRQQTGNTEQIDYAHFYVNVERVRIVDTGYYADQWKWHAQELFDEVNKTLIALTVGLIGFILKAVQFILFAGVALIGAAVFAKGMWVAVKRIWKWRRQTPPTSTNTL